MQYDIETNLEPTIAFYEDALRGSLVSASDQEEEEIVLPPAENNAITSAATTIRQRLALLLCESPGLLEYNVRKRLVPRLSRLRSSSLLGKGPLGEENIRAIATKTDSRFDEWLQSMTQGDNDEGGGDPNLDYNPSPANNNDIMTKQEPTRTPSSYMVLSNLQSGGNIGNILRSASIFGCQECLVVGQKRHRLTGDHGSRFHLPRRHFYSHDDAKKFLASKGVRIYGVEIMEDAAPIMKYDPATGKVEFPFDRQYSGAAFVMGNEGSGLSAKQREICDEFLFVPQARGATHGNNGSASLNVACAAAVVLQAYCTWAGYSYAHVDGEKFVSVVVASESGET